MSGVEGMLRFLLDRGAANERTALVTVTRVEGGGSRSEGTHMVVGESGAFRGSLSGGCVEAAVVGEARRVIRAGRAETVRFGAGSRYIDIRLPCGGGLDLLFTPSPSPRALRLGLDAIGERMPVALALDPDGGLDAAPAGPGDRTGWRDGLFVVRHEPVLRVVVVGHGEEVRAMARLASAYGASVRTISPDRALVQGLLDDGGEAHAIDTPAPTPLLEADPSTAVVLLFHDHDWEIDLLAQALGTRAFFVGAMGSRRTHAARLEALRGRGTPEPLVRRLAPRLGLIPSARDPETLALSALSQIVARLKDGERRARSVEMSEAHGFVERCEPVEAGSNALR